MGSVLFSMLSLFMMVKPCFGDADLEVAGAGDTERGRSEQSVSRTGAAVAPSAFLPLHREPHQRAHEYSPMNLGWGCTDTQLVSPPRLQAPLRQTW